MGMTGNTLRVFTDESGSPDPFVPETHNFGEKYFTLTSVLIRQRDYLIFKDGLSALRRKYSQYLLGREIKSRSIRRSNPRGIDLADPPEYEFHKHPEGQQLYEEFCADMKKLIASTPFEIVSVTVDKEFALKKYPHIHILSTVLTDLWERLFIYHYKEKIKNSRIIFDPTGRLDDEVVRSSYVAFKKYGSWFIDQDLVKKVSLYKRVFSFNSEASAGLQLADYCAYPIKRYVEGGPGPFFKEVIEPKLCKNVRDKRSGKKICLGIKRSLSR
jgi:hypothetical protein